VYKNKNPRPFTTGDFNHSSNQLKIFNLLFINHVVIRRGFTEGYTFFENILKYFFNSSSPWNQGRVGGVKYASGLPSKSYTFSVNAALDISL